MDHSTPGFVMNYPFEGSWVRFPRFWRLVLGIAFFVAATVVYRHSAHADGFIATGLLVLLGCWFSYQAMAGDLFHIKQLGVHTDGLTLCWVEVPGLLAQDTERRLQLRWDDVAAVSWAEGSQEHDQQQHLLLQLKAPFYRDKTRLRLLICEHHDFEHCGALLRQLPSHVKPPVWWSVLQKHRQQRSAQAATPVA